MIERRKSKPEDDTLIYDENADPVERASAISRLTVDGFTDIEPLLAQILRHESLFLRSQSIISLLGFFHKSRYIDDAVQMLHSDPEWMARGDAVFALSRFASRTGEQRKPIIRELVQCLMRDENSAVQRKCYEGLLLLLAPERKRSSIPDNFNRERDVDWELLKPYLDDQNRSGRRHELRV